MTKAKDISIKNYLEKLGISPKTERGGAGMYLSPLRSERTPSFKVDYFKNLWYDFGTGEGGSVIDIVMKMENLNFKQAATKLENCDFSSNWIMTPKTPPTPKTQITKVTPIQNHHLLTYLKKRAINTEIAKNYCQEVHYTQNEKNYYAIGFKNDEGAWELRNEYYKGGTSPKAPTCIDNGSETCLVFEGFMDMLSYLTLQETNNNICVLNSVVNLSKASNFLIHHSALHCYLDKDTAGKQAVAEIQNLGIKTTDQSAMYQNHKDLNEYLQSQRPRRRIKI